MFNSVDVVGSMITQMGLLIGVPTWVVPLIIAIVTVMIIFGVVSALLNREV